MQQSSIEQLLEKASAMTGLDQMDSDSYREGLSIALEGIHGNPLRTEQGAAMIEGMFTGFLATRLRLSDYVRRHPEVRQGAIRKPIFVLGLPRTGTTVLSYLLGADPGLRSLLRWEATTPVPPPTTATLKTDPRCLAMKAEDEANPSPAAALHFEPADGPTECLMITSQDFKSLFVEAFLAYPPYTEWLLNCDMSSAYAYHKLGLQVLQSQAPGTWNLKMPSHSLWIPTLLRTYPDARIIWTHRDPYKVTGSLLSMMSAVEGFTMKEHNLEYIRATYPNLLAEHVRRPMAIQDASATDPFYHLHYSAMMRDPIGQMRKLYAWLGETLTPAAETAMQAWLVDNPQGKFGKHQYHLEKFGVTRHMLEPLFADYVKRFDIELEG